MNIPFLKYRKIYFIFSGILIIASLVCLIMFGLELGIDFTGGSLLEIEYTTERPSMEAIQEVLSEFEFKEMNIQPIAENGVVLRVREKNIPNDVQQNITQKLEELGEIEEQSLGFEGISPIIGQELKRKTKIVIVLSLLIIVVYIALAFRKISRPIPSWQYGIASILALSHDILIPFGVFSILGRYYGVQITIPVITAFLVVLGYSINNTVVVFDRIRENLLKRSGITYEETVDESLNQTLTRSVNTSLTTLFVLMSIFFFGGETLKYFSLVLIIGIVFGTYSSIFLASPLLVSWLKWKEGRLTKPGS